jgi:hypothetical protein
VAITKTYVGGAGDGDAGPRLADVEACPKMAGRRAGDGAHRRWLGRAAMGTPEVGRVADAMSGAGGDDWRGGLPTRAPVVLAAIGEAATTSVVGSV